MHLSSLLRESLRISKWEKGLWTNQAFSARCSIDQRSVSLRCKVRMHIGASALTPENTSTSTLPDNMYNIQNLAHSLAVLSEATVNSAATLLHDLAQSCQIETDGSIRALRETKAQSANAVLDQLHMVTLSSQRLDLNPFFLLKFVCVPSHPSRPITRACAGWARIEKSFLITAEGTVPAKQFH